MDTAAQEFLDFIVRIKGQEMDRWIDQAEQKLTAFNLKATSEINKTSAAFKRLDERGVALHTSLATSLGGVEKLITQLNAKFADDKGAQEFMKTLIELGQSSRYTATGLDKMTASLKAAGDEAPPDFDKMAQQAKKASDGVKKVGDETKKATGEVKKGLGEQKKAAEDNAKAADKMGKAWTTNLEDMAEGVKEATAAGVIGFTALAGAAGLSLKAFGDLEAGTKTLESLGVVGRELDTLTDKAMTFGQAGEALAGNVQKAEIELNRLGFTGAEVAESIDAIVYASQASNESLAETGETVAGIVKGYALQAKDAAHVADVLAESGNRSALSLGSIQLSMKYIAPVANASNQSLEGMSAILMELSNNMILGEQAGTSVRSMLDSLNNPAGDAAKVIEHLNLKVQDASGKLRPLADIFADLQTKLSNYTDVAKSKMMSDLFGREASSAATVLLKAHTEALKANEDALHRADGASKRAADIIRQGLNAEFDKLKNKTNAAMIEIGSYLAPAVEKAVKFLSSMLDVVSGLPDPVKETAVEVGALALAFGGLALAMGASVTGGSKVLTIMKQIIDKAPLVGSALSIMGGPVGIITAVLATGTLAAVNVVNSNVDQQEAQDEQANAEKAKQSSAQAGLSALLKKADGGTNLNKLTREDLAAALQHAKDYRAVAEQKLAVDKDIQDLNKQIEALTKEDAQQKGNYNPVNDLFGQSLGKDFVAGKSNAAEIAQLKKQLDAKRQEALGKTAELAQARKDLTTHGALEQRLQAEFDKRAKPGEGTETGPEDDAKKREREQAELKRVDGFIDGQQRATKALETELAKRLAAVTKNADQTNVVQDRLAAKFLDEAKNLASSSSDCFHQVYLAYTRTFGDGGEFDKMTGKVGDNAEYAADSANRLAKDKRFSEVDINSQNYKQALANLKGPAIIVYERGAGGLSATAGHTEVYDPKSGLAYYGHGGVVNMTAERANQARVFEMKTSGSGYDARRGAQEQANLNALAAHYNQQLQDATAFRDQFPAQSEAWKKADAQVFALQQAGQAANIDLTRVASDLAEKQREAARKWALEQIDMEAAMLEAKASMTEDSLDDIGAAYKRHLAGIRSAELERLAEDGITEEQKLKLKKLYDTQRLAAEKNYNDQVRAYYKERFDYVLNLDQEHAEAQARLMAEGLDKQRALLKLEHEKRKRELEDEIELERRKWSSSPAAKPFEGRTERGDHGNPERRTQMNTPVWEESGNFQNLKRKGKDLDNAFTDQDNRLVRLDNNRRKLEAIADRLADHELLIQAKLQGQTDPEALERIKGEDLKVRLQLQAENTAELERQLEAEQKLAEASGATAENAADVENLTKKVNDSKRDQVRMEMQLTDLALERLNRERQTRQEITQQMAQSLEGMGSLVEMSQKFVGLFKGSDGKPLELLKMFGVDGKGGIDWSQLDNLINPKPAVPGRTESGDHGNPERRTTEGEGQPTLGADAIPGIMAVATEAKKVLDQFGKDAANWIADFLVNIPKAVDQEVAALTARTRQAELEVRRIRLENRKATVKDLGQLAFEEVMIIQDRTQEELTELERQAKLEEEQLIIRYKGHPDAAKQIQALWANVAAERVRIVQSAVSDVERIEREHAQNLLDLQEQVRVKLLDLQMDNAAGAAALTPGKTDDFEVERQRRYQKAQDDYNAAIKTARDQLQAAGITTIKPEETNLGLAAKTRLEQERAAADLEKQNKGLSEQQRIKGELATNEEMRARASLKGLEQEIELIEIKNRLEQAAIELKLLDPSLDPQERDALKDRLQQMEEALKKADGDATANDAAKGRMMGLDRMAEDALGSKTKLDDRVAAHHKALEQITEAERQANATLTGQQLKDALATYAARRVNAEQQVAKEIKDIWAGEYKERLEQQKTLINEGLELESRRYEDLQRIEQAKLRAAQDALQVLERDLEAKRKEREAALKPWTVDDGVQNPLWKQRLAGFDPSALAWEGVDEISNVNRRDGLDTVSGEAQRKGMLEKAELMELEAQAAFRDELINKGTYAQKIQEAQLLRAKAAQAELATAGLKTRRKLELRLEEAEAYQKFQEMERLAIEAKADLEEQVITDKMALQQAEADAAQKVLDDHARELEKLRLAAEEKIRPIDDEIKRVDKSTRDWAAQWGNVTTGISQARAEAEALLRTAQALPMKFGGLGGASGSGTSTGTLPERSRTRQEENKLQGKKGFIVDGGDGWFYETSSDRQLYQSRGMKDGGIIPPGYDGDRFGPVRLNSLEAVIPLERFPEMLRPWMPPPVQQQPSMVYAPNIDLRGSQIHGEIDLRGIVRSELDIHWRQNFLRTGPLRSL